MTTKLECCPDCCPGAGDVYVCQDCGCTILFLKSCCADDPGCCSFACCGKPMTLANKAPAC